MYDENARWILRVVRRKTHFHWGFSRFQALLP
jgi:hypothetical protein